MSLPVKAPKKSKQELEALIAKANKVTKKNKKKKKDKVKSKDSAYQGVALLITMDTQFKSTLERVERVYKSINIEREVDRLVTLHETRHIRKLSVSEVLSDQQTRLIEAELQNGANRSTAVSIHVRLTRANYTIYDSLNKLRKYIRAAFKLELKAEATTVADREYVLDMLLMKYDQWCSELEMALSIADKVIEDHDSAGYSLLRITKVLELTSRPM